MNHMHRIGFVTLPGATVTGLVGEQFGSGAAPHLASLSVGMFVMSLTDRDRFYAADLRSSDH